MNQQRHLFDPRGDPRDNTEGKVRHDARPTSREAARRIAPKTGTARAAVLEAIRARGDHGATDAEIYDLLGHRFSVNTLRPRRVELVEQRWIRASGERDKHTVWTYVHDTTQETP